MNNEDPSFKHAEDACLLQTILASDKIYEDDREAFTEMLDLMELQGTCLSKKQRAWARSVGERLDLLVEGYENLVSSGKVPRGQEVALLVKDRPLKPPGRTL